MIAEIDVTGIRIETERLILRPWEPGDLEDFHEYARIPGVGEMAGWVHHDTLAQTQAILDKFIKHRKTLALVLKENGKVIGSLGIEKLDPDPEPELLGRSIGYVLSKEYWGRGLMPEAVIAVMHHCFQVLQYDFLTCAHFESNSQSRRVIEKCGFTFLSEICHETHYGTVENCRNYISRNPRKEEYNV